MSLKISVEVPSSQHSIELACVMPTGFRQVAYDYSGASRRIIVAACDSEDTQGMVYATDDEVWAQLDAGANPQELGLQPAFTVESGVTRAARFTRLGGEAGRLVFTHITGYQPRRYTRRERKK